MSISESRNFTPGADEEAVSILVFLSVIVRNFKYYCKNV